MAADFRNFFGVSIFDIPSKVSWTEALLLFSQLKQMPESFTHVEASPGTTRRWTFLERTIMDFIDIFIQSKIPKGKPKPKEYTRPWLGAKKIGKGTMPLSMAKDFFAKLGHRVTIEEKGK